MDYKKELFAQCTPYLQWLKDRNTALDSAFADTGKQICVFPFSSCTDSVRTVLGGSMDREKIYLFANADGVLREEARVLIAKAFSAHKEALLVYADEDYYGTLEELYHISEDAFGEEILSEYREAVNGLFRGEPYFKPDFSPDTLASFFYIGNIFAVKGQAIWEIIDAYGEDVSLCELVRTISRKALAQKETFVHIPEVLYTNNRLSKKDELDCFTQNAFDGGAERLGGRNARLGRLSVIIPSKDNFNTLKQCIETFEQCAKDMDYELIVVDNGSADENRGRIGSFLEERGARYIYRKMEFNFSKMCNIGAKAADGDFLLFLNDDIEVCKAQNDGLWLRKMMRYAAMEHVGAVGIKLHYPKSGLIQHTGITNMRIGPAHKLCGMPDKGNLYHGRNLADYNMLAVTAACMLVSREKLERAGGFDEELAIAYNDVELCFRLYQMGLYNVQVNSAFLIHHESLSRGQDATAEKQARLLREKQRLYEKHAWASPKAQNPDRFYSPNLVQWEKDVEYHAEYVYDYDKLSELYQIPQKEKRMLFIKALIGRSLEKRIGFLGKIYNKLTGADRHMLNIDRIENEEGTILITGWHVLRKRDNAGLAKTLWIFNAHTTYAAGLSPMLRRDVEELFADDAEKTKNTALSGIRLKLDAAKLPKGTYQLGVAVEDGGRKWLAIPPCQFEI